MVLAWMPDEDLLNRLLDGFLMKNFLMKAKQNFLFTRRVKVRKKALRKSKILATLAIQMFTAMTTVCFSFVYSP